MDTETDFDGWQHSFPVSKSCQLLHLKKVSKMGDVTDALLILFVRNSIHVILNQAEQGFYVMKDGYTLKDD